MVSDATVARFVPAGPQSKLPVTLAVFWPKSDLAARAGCRGARLTAVAAQKVCASGHEAHAPAIDVYERKWSSGRGKR